MASVGCKLMVCLLVAASISVQGVDNIKASVMIDSSGRVEQQEEAGGATNGKTRKSMVRQAGNEEPSSSSNDAAPHKMMVSLGCGRKEKKFKDKGITTTVCMNTADTVGSFRGRKGKKTLGVRCCKKNGDKTRVFMYDYGCGGKRDKALCNLCKEKTFQQARDHCNKYELDLCTVEQLEKSECGTGCKMDRMQVWTLDHCKPGEETVAPASLVAEAQGEQTDNSDAVENDEEEEEEEDEDKDELDDQ